MQSYPVCFARCRSPSAASRAPKSLPRGDKDRQRLLTFLGAFQPASIPETIWDSVGETLASLFASGITVPFPDAVIATIAMEGQMEVWARDPHFPMMQKVLPRLQLYHEPP